MNRFSAAAAVLVLLAGCVTLDPGDGPRANHDDETARAVLADPQLVETYRKAAEGAGAHVMLMPADKTLSGPSYQEDGLTVRVATDFDLGVSDNTPTLPGREIIISGPEHWDLQVPNPMRHVRLWMQDGQHVGNQADPATCGDPTVATWTFQFFRRGVLVEEASLEPPADEAALFQHTTQDVWDQVSVRENGWDPQGDDPRDCGNDFFGPLLVAPSRPPRSLTTSFDDLDLLARLVGIPRTVTSDDAARAAERLAALLDNNGGSLVLFPDVVHAQYRPYNENGVALSSAAPGTFSHQIGDWSTLIPGHEMVLSGSEHFDIRLPGASIAVAFWFHDGYTDGRGAHGRACDVHDSQFDVRLLLDGEPMRSLRVDPPRDEPVLLSFEEPGGFDIVEVREVGAPVDRVDRATCGNDFLGAMLIVPAESADGSATSSVVEEAVEIFEVLDNLVAVLQKNTELRV